jgi:AcrR family transcriptional regulator
VPTRASRKPRDPVATVAPRKTERPGPRTQAERSSAMKGRLVDAAITSLVERGYAHTTAVEICARAGVTRGAFHHHFASLAELLIEVLERLYTESVGERSSPPATLEDLVQIGVARTRRPSFKAVIEIWLAARNDAVLGRQLAPAIQRMSKLFAPDDNALLARLVGREHAAFYRLVVEALIGLALGRAVSPDGTPVAHESAVIDLLRQLARERKPAARGKERRA